MRRRPSMRPTSVLALAALASVAVAGCAPDRVPVPSPRSHDPHGEAKLVPGLLAVDWKDGTTKAEFDADEKQFGVDLELNSPEAADEAFTIASGVDVTDELLAKIRKNP